MKTRGKIIARWDFKVNQLTITVPVKMTVPQYQDQKTHFSVNFSYGQHCLQDQADNIDELRRRVGKWLKDVVTFTASPFFYVSFSGKVDEKEGTVETHLTWEKYEVGTTADGKKMYRDTSKSYKWGNWEEGEPNVGEVDRDFQFAWNRAVHALIPATPENEAALRQLADAFDALHTRLYKFLSPDQIQHSFTSVARLLSGPEVTE